MSVQIITGDCRQVLASPLLDNTVQCVVTSPPYWGLRDYGHEDQIGHEATHLEYVETLVSVFRLIRRVLKDDGVVWLNLGDSYAGSWGAQSRGNTTGEAKAKLEGSSPLSARQITSHPLGMRGVGSRKRTPGLKNKDLCMIPARTAIALQADGWYLRSDIIWAKRNTMPESVTDRPTRSHEHVFLLSKSERYYYDRDAVRTPLKPGSLLRLGQDLDSQTGTLRANGGVRSDRPFKPAVFGGKHKSGEASKQTRLQSGNRWEQSPEQGANLRDVWHIDEDEISQFLAWKAMMAEESDDLTDVWSVSTRPFKDAHFATFPTTLIEPCIKAGSRPGDVVLDPFAGAGTTGLVCERLGRKAVLIELNPTFATMSENRIKADAPLLQQES